MTPRPHIRKRASELGCLDGVAPATDSAAIRLIQGWEGFTPCFGGEVPFQARGGSAGRFGSSSRSTPQEGEKGGEWQCLRREGGDAYSVGVFIPIDREFRDLTGHELVDPTAKGLGAEVAYVSTCWGTTTDVFATHDLIRRNHDAYLLPVLHRYHLGARQHPAWQQLSDQMKGPALFAFRHCLQTFKVEDSREGARGKDRA